MSLYEELLSQQQETINSFIRSLEEEVSQNSQQAQRLIEQQSSSKLPKSNVVQVEALITKEQQNASKLQILEEINKEATEMAEEQHHRLEEARLNLTTPLTSEVEDSEPERYGGARPKTKTRANVKSVIPSTLPQETVAKEYDSYTRVRQDQQLEDYAALLRDEVFSVIPGTVNMQHGTVSKNRKVRSGSKYSKDKVFQLPQVPDMPIAGSSHGQKVTFRSLVVRLESVSSTACLVPQPVSFNVLGIPNSETSGKDTDSEAEIRPRTPHPGVKRMREDASIALHSLQLVAEEFRKMCKPKIQKLNGGYTANAMLVFNSWLKDIEMCIKEWKLSNMEAVQLVKDYTSVSARGAIEFYLDTNSTWKYHKLIEHLWTSFESSETFSLLVRDFYSHIQ